MTIEPLGLEEFAAKNELEVLLRMQLIKKAVPLLVQRRAIYCG